jgi:sec-independent protein translocase protein TatA
MPLYLLAFGFPQGPEMIFIIILLLLLFGAKKLPGLARGLGKSAGEFKKGRLEGKREMEQASGKIEEPVKKSSEDS